MKEFEINCRIQGKGNYNADCGDLENIESVSKNIVEGTYTFYVAAESSEEALKAAPNVFSSIWENAGINCGELRDTDLSSYRDGNKEAFRISDSSELSHFTVRDKNSGITL